MLASVAVAVTAAATTIGSGGCADGKRTGQPQSLDPTPTKLDGTESQEFEADDISRAEGASQAVRDYCAGAVSEAQEVGCLSHVDEGDIP